MNKRKTVLFLLLLAVCGTTRTFAQSESDFEVSTVNGKVTITRYTGNVTAVVIPATLRGKPVVGIGYNVFNRREDITSINIPASVTRIDSAAFEGCTSLTSISIPASVTRIGSHAFVDCIGLTAISIPASVTSIENYTFTHCAGLTSINISANVTSIGWWAFSGCTRLTSISIPASVTSIGDYAFQSCTSLASISVDTRNASYTSRNGILFNKTGDTLIQYPAGLKGQYAIPSGVTRIANSAFFDCTGLTSVSIPASVISIDDNAFLQCTSLADISVDPRNMSYTSRNGVLFSKTGDTLIQYPVGLKGQYVIPAGVTRINEYAFSYCNSLTSISIGANIATSTRTPDQPHRAVEINNFILCYNRNGKKAGAYTFRNGAWSYSER